MFFLTAGRCFGVQELVSGTDDNFGSVRRNELTANPPMDALLVEPFPGVDAYQILSTKSGDFGRVTGQYRNAELTPGRPIAMYGEGTGLTYGTVDVRYTISGQSLMCATYKSSGADLGGPVFTHDQNGVKAAGMHVRSHLLPTGRVLSCFITIEDLLNRFGAYLPVFSSPTG